MKSRILLVLAFALTGALAVVIGLKIKSRQAVLAAVAAEGKQQEALANVKAPPLLVHPQPGPTTELLRVTGTLRPEADVDLAFKLAGRVVEVRVKKGDMVHAGDVLARIDERDMEAQAAQVHAGMAVAKAQNAMATDALRRSKNLQQAGALSEQQLVMAGGQANIGAASIAQAEAQGRVVDLLKQETKLVAPIDGVVVRAPSAPGFFAAPGSPLFRIERLTTLKFAANIADRDAARLQVGMPLDVLSETGVKAVGKIDLLIPSADPATRRVPLEAAVPNPDGKLMAGAFVEATVAVPAPENLSIPSTALLTGDVPAVLVVENGVLVRRAVTLLRTDKDKLLVTQGLTLTDTVLALPGTAWREGDAVPATAVVAPAAVSPASK